MDVRISKKLARIVPAEEVQARAEWLAGVRSTACAEASLVPVSMKPMDAARKATSCAVLTLKYEAASEQEHHFCYIYREGDNPAQLPHLGEGAHLCWLYSLQPDINDGRRLIAEALRKQA